MTFHWNCKGSLELCRPSAVQLESSYNKNHLFLTSLKCQCDGFYVTVIIPDQAAWPALSVQEMMQYLYLSNWVIHNNKNLKILLGFQSGWLYLISLSYWKCFITQEKKGHSFWYWSCNLCVKLTLTLILYIKLHPWAIIIHCNGNIGLHLSLLL